MVFLPCADGAVNSVEDEHDSRKAENVQRFVVVEQTNEVAHRDRDKAHQVSYPRVFGENYGRGEQNLGDIGRDAGVKSSPKHIRERDLCLYTS